MDKTYSPSVNIIRDESAELEYFVTPNARKAALSIFNDFKKGIHAFSIIGSYGTGKSSFLWALQQELLGQSIYFDISLPKEVESIKFFNVVGSYRSITDQFQELLGLNTRSNSDQVIFDALYQLYEKVGAGDGLLIIQIDEMGKFLEYAVKNNPEKELYFIQQLAEFASAEKRNILVLTTLHQSFDAYGSDLKKQDRNEWRKIKGRLIDVPFNEPIDQLLFLAAEKLDGNATIDETKNSHEIVKLIVDSKLFRTDKTFLKKTASKFHPIDPLAAYALTASLQKYGQNERSLFSFLSQFDFQAGNDELYSLSNVYDYLFDNFYAFLNGRNNSDFIQWMGIRAAIERSETSLNRNIDLAAVLIKSIGLLGLFAHKGATTDLKFFQQYLIKTKGASKKIVAELIHDLEKSKIIKYQHFNRSFRLFEGTDLDIEGVLIKAENDLDGSFDIVSKLDAYFSFPIITAKSASYRSGTPRLFEFNISENAEYTIPTEDIDGFINLIFNEGLSDKKVIEVSEKCDDPILFCLFNNTDQIRETMLQIERSNKALENIESENDLVANREIKNIITSQKALLNHYVLDALYSEKVTWIANGREIQIDTSRQLNQNLSLLCEKVYAKTPILRNELYNKHKVSSAINTARKNFFRALVFNWKEKDFGFADDKFPPEKTIYLSLLKETGIHRKVDGVYELAAPNRSSSIYTLWNECEKFMDSCKQEKRSLTDLYKILEVRPFKLKRGLSDFWIPMFLFIKRGDYALYGKQGFIPNIDDTRLHLITKATKEHEVKSFELSDARVKLFNRYREFLNVDAIGEMSNKSFIQCIRPILVLYRGLTEYSANTNRLSKGTLALRDTIAKAQDPEGVFFEDFPKALGYSMKELSGSQKIFEDYIVKFQEGISELNGSYQELLNRFEAFIRSEIINMEVPFEEYKEILRKRYSSIRSHKLLKHQKTFILRLNSPIEERDSWLESIAHSIIGKKLQSITDPEEEMLKDGLEHMVSELDNLCSIYKESDPNSETFKFDLTTIENGLQEKVIRISKGDLKKVKKEVQRINNELGKDKQTRLAVLSILLKNELNG